MSGKDDGKIEVQFMQVNDVYEIAPLSGGREGGMARAATIKKQYQQKNPNTFLVIAGDFLSPSIYHSMQYEGKGIRGRQMVDVLNAAGVDFAVFGNHEFDIKETELQERINESKFSWIASNTFHKLKDSIAPFTKEGNSLIAFPKTHIITAKDKDGTTATIGLIGITLPFNKADYVTYTDPLQTAKELYNQLKDSVDAVVAITHQALEDDIILAKEIPGLAFILGGHEHDNRFEKQGKIHITKAHANAKSAYVLRLSINKKKGKLKVDPKLETLNEKVAMDSVTNEVVKKWTAIAEKNYSSLGFNARKVLVETGEALEGRETEIRSRSTNLTRLIVAAMAYAAPKADVVLFNSGSIRVDDVLQMPLTEYDILRSLPFGGSIREADIKGTLLLKTLDQGVKNRGNGGFIQYNENLVYDANANIWKLNNSAIDPAKVYKIAISEFLFSGKEANLEFLSEKNPEVVKAYDIEKNASSPLSDIRRAVIQYLEKKR